MFSPLNVFLPSTKGSTILASALVSFSWRMVLHFQPSTLYSTPPAVSPPTPHSLQPAENRKAPIGLSKWSLKTRRPLVLPSADCTRGHPVPG